MAGVLAVLAGICAIITICFFLCGLVQIGLLILARNTNAWEEERDITFGLLLLIGAFLIAWTAFGLLALGLGYDV